MRQVPACKRRAANLWTGLVLLLIMSRDTVGAGFMPRFYLVELCAMCCVCCVLLFEIPGVSKAKAVRFWFCFYVQIRIAWHVRASLPEPAKLSIPVPKLN